MLQALQGTCSLWCMGVMSTWQLLCDAWVAFVMVLVHGLTLMCQVSGLLCLAWEGSFFNNRQRGLFMITNSGVHFAVADRGGVAPSCMTSCAR